MFQLSDRWKMLYPSAHVGVLVMRNVSNPPHHAELEKRKSALEGELRARFAGQDRAAILSHPILKAYDDYYRQFKKTYHVQLQLESIVFKGKSIPSVAALVEAMFMAEMNDLLLTAGHDLDSLHLPLTLDVAQGTESYTLLHGEPQTPKAGDMLIRDGEGIISSIIYGPDQRTQITSQTRNAVFTTYAPSGISEEALTDHLREIQQNAKLITPNAQVEMAKVFSAQD
ncbi:MAG TPA: phenylalanine--tRNA ligase beta subunit-related protein [Anaerolineales bacterium]|nr:phenylalanine--tRNA ligase beta subunit-related protein [Anaerolineales bacterium]